MVDDDGKVVVWCNAAIDDIPKNLDCRVKIGDMAVDAGKLVGVFDSKWVLRSERDGVVSFTTWKDVVVAHRRKTCISSAAMKWSDEWLRVFKKQLIALAVSLAEKEGVDVQVSHMMEASRQLQRCSCDATDVPGWKEASE